MSSRNRGNVGNVRKHYTHHQHRRHNDSQEEERSDSSSNNRQCWLSGQHHRRHPAGLHGREIGLYYRDKNKARQNEESAKMVASINLSQEKINEIRTVLNLPDTDLGDNPENTFYFDENIQSDFKKEFMSILSVSFEEKVQQIQKNKIDLTELSMNTEDINERMYAEFIMQREQPQYKNMLEFRKELPAFKMKDKIVEMVKQNQVILVSGETGCGKTTQVSQFLLDEAIMAKKGSECRIICTQPRRISAITIAERVAAERDENLGHSVGYQIRMEKELPRAEGGNILYCTTGVLLKFLQNDPIFDSASHLIMDEIHERNTDSDLLLAILKKINEYRPDLKIILMSATLKAESFSVYFQNCPVINIQGFTYPVEIKYLEDVLDEIQFFNFPTQKTQHVPKWRRHTKYFKKEDQIREAFRSFIEPYARSLKGQYSEKVIQAIQNIETENNNLELIQELIFHISVNKGPGAILVFLSGFDKITKMNRMLKESKRFASDRFEIYALHSRMPTFEQKNVFRRPPDNVRKIILATNIAETSITIDDIVYVIDAGKMKLTKYNVQDNIETLNEEWVTVANATQRRGRAGRVQPGICYHLFTKARSYVFEQYPVPEIVRIRLENVILQIKILGFMDIEQFFGSLMTQPKTDIIKISLNLLKRLAALDNDEHLTPLGLHLAKLPMDPQTGKMILLAGIFSCIDPITTVAANLTFKDAFMKPLGHEKHVDEVKLKFAKDYRSDHLMLANVMDCWIADGRTYSFCRNNYLNSNTLKQLETMKIQFCEYLLQMQFITSADPEDSESNKNTDYGQVNLLRAIICAGLYPNLAGIKNIKIKGRNATPIMTITTPEDGKVKLHPSSVNANQTSFKTRYLVYHVKMKTSAHFLFDTTMVNPLSIVFFGDKIKYEEDHICIADYIKFKCNKDTMKLIMNLRDGLDKLLKKKICHPSPIDWKSDEGRLLKAIVHLITIDGENEYSSGNELNMDSEEGTDTESGY